MKEQLSERIKVKIELNSPWTGPVKGKNYSEGLISPEEWPYGPPSAHQKCCVLFEGGAYCDCEASADKEDNEETGK